MSDNQELMALPLTQAIAAYTPQLAAALPEDVPVGRFERVFLTALNQTPELTKCDRRSLFQAVIRCAQDGLYPDGREAALVPFGGTVTYIPMVHGYRIRLEKTGKVVDITCEVVYQNDHFRRVLGEASRIEHEPPALDQPRGDPIGAYCIIKLTNGGAYRDVMSRAEIERIRDTYSKASRSDAPWKTNPLEMWRKTVLRRCAKQVPFSARDIEQFAHWRDRTIEHDDDGYVPVPDQPVPPRITHEDVTENGPARPPRTRQRQGQGTKQAETQADTKAAEPPPPPSTTVTEAGGAGTETQAEPPTDQVVTQGETVIDLPYSFTSTVGEVFEFSDFAEAVAVYAEMIDAADTPTNLQAVWSNGSDLRAALTRDGHTKAVDDLAALANRRSEALHPPPRPVPPSSPPQGDAPPPRGDAIDQLTSFQIPFDGVAVQGWYKQARARLEDMRKQGRPASEFTAFQAHNQTALDTLKGPGPNAFRSLWEILDKEIRFGARQSS